MRAGIFVLAGLVTTVTTVMSSSVSALDLPDPLPCAPCFIGQLRLSDNGSDTSGKTKVLADDLYFVDLDRFVWKAGKNDVTDGASIPELFQPLVGGPFESDYLPAAVIHDHYTNRAHRVRTWQDTAKTFYQAMIVNGVNTVKAKTMYFAVYTFGPHWGLLAKGVPCGTRCIFTVPTEVTVATGGNVITTGVQMNIPSGRVYAEESANYSSEHAAEIEDIRRKIEASELRGTPLSLKDIAGIATLNHGGNAFLVSE